MMLERLVNGKFSKKSYSAFILGADIGGTNTSIGVFGIKQGTPILVFSFHFKSRELKSLHYAVSEVLEYMHANYGINVSKGCIAGAGAVSPKKDFINITKLGWRVDKKTLSKNTQLKEIILINDFEAVGYGINMLSKNDISVIKKAGKIPKSPIVVIGAGTGLGKSTLIYNESLKSYASLPSEAGHCDFPAQGKEEIELVEFIRKYRKIKGSISYEQIVSGMGIDNIYSFLRKSGKIRATKYTKEIDNSEKKPELISKYGKADETCRKTFEIFKNGYSKFAANCALDSLPYGGVYIAGGIAPKNPGIFDSEFVRKFEKHHERQDVLKKIPIYLVMNYDVGLLGAGFVGAKMLS